MQQVLEKPNFFEDTRKEREFDGMPVDKFLKNFDEQAKIRNWIEDVKEEVLGQKNQTDSIKKIGSFQKIYSRMLEIEDVRNQINQGTDFSVKKNKEWIISNDSTFEKEVSYQKNKIAEELWQQEVQKKFIDSGWNKGLLAWAKAVPLVGGVYRAVATTMIERTMSQQLSEQKYFHINDKYQSPADKKLDFLVGKEKKVEINQDIVNQINQRKITGINLVDQALDKQIGEVDLKDKKRQYMMRIHDTVSAFLKQHMVSEEESWKVARMMAVCGSEHLEAAYDAKIGTTYQRVTRFFDEKLMSFKNKYFPQDNQLESFRKGLLAVTGLIAWRAFSNTNSVTRGALGAYAFYNLSDKLLLNNKYIKLDTRRKVSELQNSLDEKMANLEAENIQFMSQAEKLKLQNEIKLLKLHNSLNLIDQSNPIGWDLLSEKQQLLREKTLAKTKEIKSKKLIYDLARKSLSVIIAAGAGTLLYISGASHESVKDGIDKMPKLHDVRLGENNHDNLFMSKAFAAENSDMVTVGGAHISPEQMTLDKLNAVYGSDGHVDMEKLSQYCKDNHIYYNHNVKELIQNNSEDFVKDHDKLRMLLNHTSDNQDMMGAWYTGHNDFATETVNNSGIHHSANEIILVDKDGTNHVAATNDIHTGDIVDNHGQMVNIVNGAETGKLSSDYIHNQSSADNLWVALQNYKDDHGVNHFLQKLHIDPKLEVSNTDHQTISSWLKEHAEEIKGNKQLFKWIVYRDPEHAQDVLNAYINPQASAYELKRDLMQNVLGIDKNSESFWGRGVVNSNNSIEVTSSQNTGVITHEGVINASTDKDTLTIGDVHNDQVNVATGSNYDSSKLFHSTAKDENGLTAHDRFANWKPAEHVLTSEKSDINYDASKLFHGSDKDGNGLSDSYDKWLADKSVSRESVNYPSNVQSDIPAENSSVKVEHNLNQEVIIDNAKFTNTPEHNQEYVIEDLKITKPTDNSVNNEYIIEQSNFQSVPNHDVIIDQSKFTGVQNVDYQLNGEKISVLTNNQIHSDYQIDQSILTSVPNQDAVIDDTIIINPSNQ